MVLQTVPKMFGGSEGKETMEWTLAQHENGVVYGCNAGYAFVT